MDDFTEILMDSTVAPPPSMPLPKSNIVNCGRCFHTKIDLEKEPDPYQYGARGWLCKACVRDLGLGKNMDQFMGVEKALEPAKRGRA